MHFLGANFEIAKHCNFKVNRVLPRNINLECLHMIIDEYFDLKYAKMVPASEFRTAKKTL